VLAVGVGSPDSVAVAQTAGVTFIAGTPVAGQSTFHESPTSLPNDGSQTSLLSLTVMDINNNPVPNFAVSFGGTALGGGTFTFAPASGSTDANGFIQSSFSDVGGSGSTTISATGTSFTKSPAEGAITVNTGAACGANSIWLPMSPVTADGVSPMAFTITLKDGSGGCDGSHGTLITSGTVGVSCNGSATTVSLNSTTPNSSGQVTGSLKSTVAQAETCTATYTPTAGVAAAFKTATAVFTPGIPSDSKTSTTVTVNPANALADNTQTITLSLVVRDGNGTAGNPVPGVTVTFTGIAGDTFTCISGGSAPGCTTNASGTAIATLRSTKARADVSPPSNTSSIHLNIASLTQRNASVTFTPGAASHLDFVQQPPTSVAAATVMAPAIVRFLDKFNNPTTCVGPDTAHCSASATSISVSLANAGSTPMTLGKLDGNTTVATTSTATFNTLSISGASAGSCDATLGPCRALVASSGALGTATSGTIVLQPANGSSCLCSGPTNNCSGSGGSCATGVAGEDGNHNWVPGNNTQAHIAAGVYNFASITIPAGVTVTTDGTGVLELHASGDVTINGTIDVSGGAGGSARGQGTNGGGFGGASGTTTAPSIYGAVLSGTDGHAWGGGGASFVAYGGGPTTPVPANWGAGYGAYGGGSYYGTGGAPMGGGGGGGSAAYYDQDSGGGGGGGGHAGGAGGFAAGDSCVAAGGAGGGPNGAPLTPCANPPWPNFPPSFTWAFGGAASNANGCPLSGYAGGAGGVGSSGCTPIAGSGGGGSIGCDAANDLPMATTLRPGSGGGGGGNGGDNNGPNNTDPGNSGGGGGGGGGGGALRIVSNTKIVLASTGQIRAIGGAGGAGAVSSDDCDDDSGGGGGGGSGGAIWLQAPILTAPAGSMISAQGGGGGSSGGSKTDGPGGAGGPGRIRLSVDATLSGAIGGSFYPPLLSGFTPTPGAGTALKVYVAQYPQ